MQPCIIFNEDQPQLVINDTVYVYLKSLYLAYMELYRSTFGNVDRAMSLDELRKLIDQTAVGGLFRLCSSKSGGFYCGKLLQKATYLT